MKLAPSQRIVLIKEIADRLSYEEYSLIDLTLEQYQLPTTDQWSGSKNEYVLRSVSRASDDSLRDLAAHVGFVPRSTAATRIEPQFWRKGMLKVFISHLATHREFAEELQRELLAFGISSFVAHTDIEPTREWQTEIETALATCDGLVALLHPKFHQSKWTDQEVGFAMGRGRPVFSVRFGEDPYGFIGRFQAFEGNHSSAREIANELFDTYRRNEETQPMMAEILIARLEVSRTFDSARLRVQHLEELDSWDSSFSARLRAAVKNNDQVAGAWGVADRIKALIDKWTKRGYR